jgi:hypothetical protein
VLLVFHAKGEDIEKLEVLGVTGETKSARFMVSPSLKVKLNPVISASAAAAEALLTLHVPPVTVPGRVRVNVPEGLVEPPLTEVETHWNFSIVEACTAVALTPIATVLASIKSACAFLLMPLDLS